MKVCPYCGESIRNEAIKCRYCGEMLMSQNPASDNVSITDSQEIVKSNGVIVCGVLCASLTVGAWIAKSAEFVRLICLLTIIGHVIAHVKMRIARREKKKIGFDIQLGRFFLWIGPLSLVVYALYLYFYHAPR